MPEKKKKQTQNWKNKNKPQNKSQMILKKNK